VATRQFTKDELTCPDCGYVAKAPQGLSSHQRSNGHGPYKKRPKTTRKKTGRRRKKTTARKTTARKTTARKTTARKTTARKKTTARVGAPRTTPLSQALRATRRAAEKERAQLLDRVEQLDGVIQQIDSMNV
jgi:uncharacterized C2H2 Zn-finger protein